MVWLFDRYFYNKVVNEADVYISFGIRDNLEDNQKEMMQKAMQSRTVRGPLAPEGPSWTLETESPFCTIWSSVLLHAGVEMGAQKPSTDSSLSWGESSVSLSASPLPAHLSLSAPLHWSPVSPAHPSLSRRQGSAELLLLPGSALPLCHLLLLLCLADAVPFFVSTSTPILLPQALSRSRWSMFHTLYCSGFQPWVISTPKETFGNVQRHLWLSQLGKRVTWAFHGSRPGTL